MVDPDGFLKSSRLAFREINTNLLNSMTQDRKNTSADPLGLKGEVRPKKSKDLERFLNQHWCQSKYQALIQILPG